MVDRQRAHALAKRFSKERGGSTFVKFWLDCALWFEDLLCNFHIWMGLLETSPLPSGTGFLGFCWGGFVDETHAWLSCGQREIPFLCIALLLQREFDARRRHSSRRTRSFLRSFHRLRGYVLSLSLNWSQRMVLFTVAIQSLSKMSIELSSWLRASTGGSWLKPGHFYCSTASRAEWVSAAPKLFVAGVWKNQSLSYKK